MQAATPVIQLVPAEQVPDSPQPSHEHHSDPLHGLDAWLETALGIDLRLLYGMLVPILLVIGLIIALVIGRTYWLVAAVMVPEIAFLGLIVTKILAMLDEPDD